MSQRLVLVLFIVGTLGLGLLIGGLSVPDEWYQGLRKPSFNPPPWLFAPVWSVLYVIIGVAGWRIWRLGDGRPALAVWFGQMALNFLWTPTFFVAHQIGLALAIIVALFAAILLFIGLAWRRDRAAALLFLPYAAWVGFASVLNAAIWRLN